MANVTAYSDVLVVDMVGGLVTGAVAERLGGTGYVCNTYKGSSPYPVEMVRMFNFSDKVLKRYVRLVSLVFFSFLSSLSNCSRSI
jgi:tRNA (adenine-N(1)-)-methyltransferase non-catalytic subunit